LLLLLQLQSSLQLLLLFWLSSRRDLLLLLQLQSSLQLLLLFWLSSRRDLLPHLRKQVTLTGRTSPTLHLIESKHPSPAPNIQHPHKPSQRHIL